MNQNYTFAGTAIAVLIIGIMAMAALLFSGCVLNNENIIQYGSDDSLKETAAAEGTVQATIEGPLKQL